MKWKGTLFVLAMLACVLLAAGCGAEHHAVAPAPPDQTLDERADAIVAAMSDTEKVGQMVMIGIRGEEADEDSLYMLHQFHIGGVLLFDRNLRSAKQTQKLTRDLQADAEQKVPLFIGIDEEGGRVVRGTAFIPAPPAQQQLGMSGDLAHMEDSASRTAEALKDLGFNVNFAPVADVSTEPRSFASDPNVAAKCVLAAARGYEAQHMVYVLKHFPGIGRGTVDSHEEGSAIPATAEELAARDLVPFHAVIDAKRAEDYMILVSHLRYPAYDADDPASLSKAIQTDLLREQLGYRGLIVTDDVEMGAIARHYAPREIGVRAVEAGADIVLSCQEIPFQTEVYLGLLDAVQSGAIPMERIDESVRRIVKAKLTHAEFWGTDAR